MKAARLLEEKIQQLGAENVAAFIGEPVQGAGGVYDPPPGYWAEIQRICRKHDVLLVADEVICGFGRTGHWFGSQTYGIDPDLMPMAKGLSSGYLPIAGVAIHDRIWQTIHDGGALAHGYTYSGHPVACAVAIANIQLLKSEGIVERVREDIAPYFRKCLQQLADSHPLVGEVRGVGPMPCATCWLRQPPNFPPRSDFATIPSPDLKDSRVDRYITTTSSSAAAGRSSAQSLRPLATNHHLR